MSAPPPLPRTYRLSPPDRTGFVFGLGFTQLIVIAASVVVGTVLMMAGVVLVGIAIVAVGVGVGVARVRGATVVEQLPHAVRFARHRVRSSDRYFAPLPLLGGDRGAVPSVFAHLSVRVVDSDNDGVGRPVLITCDARTSCVAASLRVSGRSLALLDTDQHEWLLAGWGNALQTFVTERPTVTQLRWSEFAAPLSLDAHRQWLAANRSAEPVTETTDSYGNVLADAEERAIHHEVLVTVCVREARGTDPACDCLLRELRLLTQRLETAGLHVSAPLSPDEWVRAMRQRLDPTSLFWHRDRTLAEIASDLAFASVAPSAASATWHGWQTDSVWHRALYVVEWPRTDVAAPWLGQLIGYRGAVRSITVGFEPVPRSRSQRSVVRDAAKITSDAEHRAERGFRVGAAHRRAAQAVEEREHELVAGYGEFTYAGVITLTAPNIDELDDATEQITRLAASIGVELKPLHGRHDLGFVVALPIARGFATQRRVR